MDINITYHISNAISPLQEYMDVFIVKASFLFFNRRDDCNHGNGFTPLYVNVNMKDGEMINYWIDALQAAWPGVQVSSTLCVVVQVWDSYG